MGYLNGAESFDGGIFRVFRSPSNPWFEIQPEAGKGFLFRQGQKRGYLHDAGVVDLSRHPDGFKSIVRIDFVYKLNEEESDAEKLKGWRQLGERPEACCPYCPERFRKKDDQYLHKGVHNDPASEAYYEWARRLDVAYDEKLK